MERVTVLEGARNERPAAGQIAAITALYALVFLPLVTKLQPEVILYIYFLVLLRLASLRWTALAPGRWLLLPFTLGGGLVVFDAYHSVSGQEAGTALLATMLALKLLEMHRVRDVRLGATLFGFMVISQFLFDQSALLALYFALLLVGDFALFVDLCERYEHSPIRRSLRVSARLMLQAMPLALVLFVFFPRLSAPLWGFDEFGNRAISGLSPELEPGSVSELVINGELAFRVRFNDIVPAMQKLYWRGPVLWRAEGRRWLPMGKGRLLIPQDAPKKAEERTRYEVTLEPSGGRWLLALDIPIQVPEDATLTSDFQVVVRRPITSARVYRMESAMSYQTGDLDADQRTAGLQLPRNITGRMLDLAARWQQGARGPDEIVRNGLAYFNEQPFHYTLLPPKLGDNPADEFLFETRRGFCEHYASSFALLMRLSGIPSRIVLGYLGGEYNQVGGYLIVRQSDAHAWVEVWLEEKGWVRVDPTEAVAPERIESSDLLSGLGSGSPVRFRLDEPSTLLRWMHNLDLVSDAMSEQWRRWVLGYDYSKQQRLLQSSGLEFLREYGLVVAMASCVAAVLALLIAHLNRGEVRQEPIAEIYRRFCARMARIGLVRRPDEGPLSFCRRIQTTRPDLSSQVLSFIELYLPLRYGDGAVGTNRRELEHRLRRFKPKRKGPDSR